MNQHKNNSAQLEQLVEQAIEQLLEKYKNLDCLADEMLRRQANSESIEEQMKRLNQGKREIQEIEEQSRGLKEEYRNTQPRASAAIASLTKQTAELLLGTIKKIDSLESQAREAHRKLVPSIDQSVRVNQMQKAYGG
ncbi:hypothetical protein N9B12_00200 [bacterium]|jgi:hypothetical protein|nr:hypothetical protein [bacterium]MDA7887457.1 hypothetical protein [bacterium]MDB4368402.1 hypothetical protein [Mariniblastus sp.]MDB4379801.1 hypothetical protein [Mariniblastus sp.]MDB4386249.1 hypothetical protein [bacterium]